MRRIRITISENARGWRWRREQWDTKINGEFYGRKHVEQGKTDFPSAGEVMHFLGTMQRLNDRECREA